MRVTVLHGFLVLLFCTSAFAKGARGQDLLDRKISLTFNQADLKTALREISTLSGVKFSYSRKIFSIKDKITLKAKDQTLKELLPLLLKPFNIVYSVVGHQIILNRPIEEAIRDERNSDDPEALAAYSRTITGTVVDDQGKPVAGVSVTVKGTTRGTATNERGAFEIKADDGDILVFSNVGYENNSVTLTSASDRLTIKLTASDKNLDDVVVTALGIKRDRRSLGYAVSTIKGDELVTAGATMNPFLAIYGKAAGVGVNIGASGPEGGVKINIRGAASMNPNSNVRPLFVVDGVILSDRTSSIGGSVASGFDYGAGINDINSEDIESIEILKGAKATVLYGSDAANGVVLITTKSGRNTRGFGMTGSFQYTVEKPVSYMKTQNEYGLGDNIYDTSYTTVGGRQVRQIPLKRFSFGPKFDGSDVMFSDSSIVKNVAHPNNYIGIFQMGHSSTSNVAIAGSSEKGNMRASYTNYNYQDITNSDAWQRRNTFSFNGNLKASSLASFEVISNIYSVTTQNRRGSNGGSVAWGFPSDYDFGKIWPLVTDATGYKRDLSNYGVTQAITQLGVNYLWPLKQNRYKDDKLHMITSAKMTLNFSKNLFLIGQAGIDYDNTDYTTETSVDRIAPTVSGGSFGYAKENSTVQTYQALLNYDKSFMQGDLHLFTFAGGIYRLSSSNYLGSTTVGGLIYPGWYSFANELGPASPGNEYLIRNFNRGNDVLYSGLASATLSWKNELYLELQGREDWNSTLPPGNNKYFYPGASLTWNYTERFAIPGMNRGQLRLAWADVGNGTSRYYANNNYTFGQLQGSNAVTVSPPSYFIPGVFVPEKKREFEVGINNTFFKGNRVVVDFSFYTNNRYNQITGIPISTASSSTSLRINAGNVKNWGYELSLTGTPVLGKDIRWDLTLNAASQNSKVLKLYPGVTINPFKQIIGNVYAYADQGRPYGEIKMYDYVRDSSGNKVVGANGLYSLDQQKYVETANIMPHIYGGFISDFYYKGFNFRIGLDYKYGGTIFSITNNYLTGNGQGANTLQYRDQEHGGMAYYIDKSGNYQPWQHNTPAPPASSDGRVYHDGLILPGTMLSNGKYVKNTTLTSATNYYETYINDLYQYWPPDHLYKNDYIKVREIAVAYTLPKTLANKLRLQKLTMTLAARNLFYLYKTVPNIDPEGALGADSYLENTIYPSQRTWSFGFTVSF